MAIDVYGEFSSIKDDGFKDQITRASVSISNNIAEGFDRNSKADFARFLYFFFILQRSEINAILGRKTKLHQQWFQRNYDEQSKGGFQNTYRLNKSRKN